MIFKCKMCGAPLQITGDEKVVTCEYCNSQNTLPKLDDDRRSNLYDRADHFRRNNDYDKAMSIYEKILEEDNTDAEAYWSIVLCRFGIEYVEDPSTHQMMPTINRMQLSSILADDDYRRALEYASGIQKDVYIQQAKEIEKIQKNINQILKQEEPYDVFISYKSKDETGRRTKDSVKANELYHELTKEGFKVFYADISLENHIGESYEPYIFSALNSAKVMVVIGSKKEYLEAPWVKNEWSRYLALIKKGVKKTLIPAYIDMDPYDLPDEFAHLQAQDMNKLGFLPDLIRGIKKLVEFNQDKPVSSKKVIDEKIEKNAVANIDNLLERAFMFLEDNDFEKANEYFEKVLDLDPKCAKAYLGKLMYDEKKSKKSFIYKAVLDKHFTSNSFYLGKDNIFYPNMLSANKNYKKAYEYADENLKKELAEYQKGRYYDVAITIGQFLDKYEQGHFSTVVCDSVYTDEEYIIELYQNMLDDLKKADTYKNASQLITPWHEKFNQFVINTIVASNFKEEENFLSRLDKMQREVIKKELLVQKEAKYQEILTLMADDNNEAQLLLAMQKIEQLININYKNIVELDTKCKKKLNTLYERQYNEAFKDFNPLSTNTTLLIKQNKQHLLIDKAYKAKDILEKIKKEHPTAWNSLDKYQKALTTCEDIIQVGKVQKHKAKSRKIKVTIILSIIIPVLLIISIVSIVHSVSNLTKYNKAIEALSNQDYQTARQYFMQIRDYKDVESQYETIQFKDLAKGEIIQFGYIDPKLRDDSYFMTGFKKSDASYLEWIVLDQKENQVLLLSKAIISYYSEEYNTFFTEKLHSYTEETKLSSWFTENERTHIVEVQNVNQPDTLDTFFPLTLAEFEQYANDPILTNLVKYPTQLSYIEKFLKDYDSEDYTGMNLYRDYWYLNTYQDTKDNPIACVNIQTGNVEYINTIAYNGFYAGFRPAVWVTVEE